MVQLNNYIFKKSFEKFMRLQKTFNSECNKMFYIETNKLTESMMPINIKYKFSFFFMKYFNKVKIHQLNYFQFIDV